MCRLTNDTAITLVYFFPINTSTLSQKPLIYMLYGCVIYYVVDSSAYYASMVSILCGMVVSDGTQTQPSRHPLFWSLPVAISASNQPVTYGGRESRHAERFHPRGELTRPTCTSMQRRPATCRPIDENTPTHKRCFKRRWLTLLRGPEMFFDTKCRVGWTV